MTKVAPVLLNRTPCSTLLRLNDYPPSLLLSFPFSSPAYAPSSHSPCQLQYHYRSVQRQQQQQANWLQKRRYLKRRWSRVHLLNFCHLFFCRLSCRLFSSNTTVLFCYYGIFYSFRCCCRSAAVYLQCWSYSHQGSIMAAHGSLLPLCHALLCHALPCNPIPCLAGRRM